ncbi:MFS transporter [Brachybacterium sp. NPDC056505]|uniref:MFS transporter n=1 Tax=Brachybacterium sp. NPDC056505 TaxID=3345843 RepID=UPI003670D8B7
MSTISYTPQKWRPEQVTITEPSVIRRAIGAAAIGNITEWYDFGVYGYLQVTIEGVFLPKNAGAAGAIIVAALFAVAFLVRPLGGMFFGPLADRIGRKSVLATTMIMMALGTFLIGVLPDYATIGLAAPFLLLACRLIQGFSTGGEYGNAMAFIAEYAPDRRRGFFGSLLEVGTFGGYVLGASVATIMTAILTQDQLLSWGWRLPFFVALPLGLVGVYLRSKLEDTPAYRELEKQQDAEAKAKVEEKEAAKKAGAPVSTETEDTKKGRGEIKGILRLWPNLLACMGLVLAWNVTNYMLTAFMPQFFPMIREYQGSGGVSDLASSILQIIVMVMCLVLIPVVGRLSDRVGRKAVVRAGSIALIVLSIPSVLLIRGNSDVTVMFGLLIMGLSLICFSATMPSTLPSLFPTAVRAGALSISFNVAISLFGGTTSTVMTSLVTWTHFLMWPAIYLMAAGVIGLICVHIVPESNGRPLWGSKPAASDRKEATAHAKELSEEAESFVLAQRAGAH